MYNRLTAMAFAACIAGTGAMAATFNFQADADAFWDANVPNQSRYEGTFDQVYGISTIDGNARATAAGTLGGNTDGGITVTALATAAGVLADPFMDANNAGLGVCSSGVQGSGISECSSGSGSNTGDDNLVSPEELTLMFNTSVALTGLQIRDADHNLINNTVGALFINGMLFDTGANGQVDLTGLGDGSSFVFTSNGTAPGDELYLSVLTADLSQVPLPASLPLLAAGFGLMGWTARRRQKS